MKARLHSWLHPACEVRAATSGRGVFAGRAFTKGEVVAVWGGVVRTEAELMAAADSRVASHSICVAEGFYLAWDQPAIDSAEMFNHSCDPNLGVQGQIVVVARRDLASNEELTFDYDTTETMPQPWQCSCGSLLCRGTIDGRGWKDPAFVRRNIGFLAPHVEQLARDAGTWPTEAS